MTPLTRAPRRLPMPRRWAAAPASPILIARPPWLYRWQSTRSAAHQQRQFELLVPALRAFHRLHGHFAVPLRFTVPESVSSANEAERWPTELEGMKLGTTLSRFLKVSATAKAPSKCSRLNTVKTQLRELGISDVDDWKRFLWEEVTVAAMRTYRSVHGDLLMPALFKVPHGDDTWPRATWGYKLGYWASELRRRKRNLLPHQLEDLSRLQFDWNVREARWNRYYMPAMQRYTELHGSSNVPQSFVVPKDDPEWPTELRGYRLGQKVSNLRCGDPLGTGPTAEDEWQEVELIYKSWMLLQTLHDEEDGDTDDGDDEAQSEGQTER
ncbi:hypothetical protein BBJ28_00016649 [Nothophytophthora sp. Chile5]|nr:hypothetical protein BBJ28_00016649 [Nothophytophthora sp. Chile5]